MSRLIQELLAAIPAPRPDQAREPTRRARARSTSGSRKEAARRKCTFDLSQELAQELRRLCEVQGLTQREVVERLISAHVARHRHQL